MASSAPPDAQHLLSLRVMRLSRPGFAARSTQVVDRDPALPASESLPALLAGDMLAEHRGEHDMGLSGLTDFLTLPPSFGNIYLGETFSAYLCVNNESATPVLDVAFKAELQTASQRFTLADTLTSSSSGVAGSVSNTAGGSTSSSSSGVPVSLSELAARPALGSSQGSLLPSQSAEFVIHHEIKELGVHILVCSVHYTPGSAGGPGAALAIGSDRERRFFRKFYKFQVLNPLSVKTKVHTLQTGRVFLEAQVQNISTLPMYLERMAFEPSEHFQYEDINATESSNNRQDGYAGSVFGPRELIGQQDTRQYLYMLTPRSAGSSDQPDISARMAPGLGKLDIIWRTLLGQSGRLQTSQLSRKVPPVDPFEISVVEQPDVVRVEEPFRIKIRAVNHVQGERFRLAIRGAKSKMANVLLCGPNEVDLGTIDGGAHLDADLEFFALHAGLQKIGGLQVLDRISGTLRDLDSLAVVRVL